VFGSVPRSGAPTHQFHERWKPSRSTVGPSRTMQPSASS
jgi:hypothetical protein